MKKFQVVEISSYGEIREPFEANNLEDALSKILEEQGYKVAEVKEDIDIENINSVIFTCPSCKQHRLECCEDGPYVSEILNIDEEGDFDYGEIEASGIVDRFQCLNCGYVLTREDGSSIDDNEEVVEWIKEHC